MAQDTLNYLVLDRYDHEQNMARFYVLSIEENLFGDMTLVRGWGRIGTVGRNKIEIYENEGRATEALETWLRRKIRRGYSIRVQA
jgi:predicted DNA-binding WGR domain protein